MSSDPPKTITIQLGVTIAREAIDNPWQDHIWRPVSVFLDAEPVTTWRLLEQRPGYEHFHVATLPLELHRKETPGYIANLTSDAPGIYVVIRPGSAEHDGSDPVHVPLITASAHDVEVFGHLGEEVVGRVAMPEPVRDLLEAFIDAHHVEEPFASAVACRICAKRSISSARSRYMSCASAWHARRYGRHEWRDRQERRRAILCTLVAQETAGEAGGVASGRADRAAVRRSGSAPCNVACTGCHGTGRRAIVCDHARPKPMTEDDFKDVDFRALDYGSDYGRFMQDGVPEGIRQKALTKLWHSDPIFTQVDPFQDYAGDYTDAAVGASSAAWCARHTRSARVFCLMPRRTNGIGSASRRWRRRSRRCRC